ncbi:MAG TPA: hypothetical protein VFZ00_09150 [Solirubrobacter sp.]|jgi:hypothetical protein|nr:hypothetical protein [Solirubrobacter sp.]
MRLAPRLAVGFTMLALVAGCGGSSQVAFEEAPGGPADLKVPGDASALAPEQTSATPTPTPTGEATEQSTDQAQPEATAEAPQQQEQTEGTEEGGTEAPSTDGTPPDSDASEEFCAVNPGAC